MSFADKTLRCRDCEQEFTFTAGEQEFYAEKGFQNEPTRCRECRDARSAGEMGGRTNGQGRQLYTVTCADCGVKRKFLSSREAIVLYTAAVFCAHKAM